jgi:DNA-binding XRE family transcriptional regulator
MPARIADSERVALFWSRVDKLGPIPAHAPELGPCWLWTAGCLTAGYGATTLIHGFRTAHCASFFLAHGKIGDGAFVCHKCSVPRCVNPGHLYEGDSFTNMADKTRHGRTGLAKYLADSNSDPHPRVIRAIAFREARIAKGLRQQELADLVGVSKPFVSHIENTIAPMPKWLEEPWANACGVPLSSLPSSTNL